MTDSFTEAFIGVRVRGDGSFTLKLWVRGVMQSARTHGQTKGMTL